MSNITLLLNAATGDGPGNEGKTSRKMQVTAEGNFDGAAIQLHTRPNVDFTYKPLTLESDGSVIEITDEVADMIIDGIARHNDIVAVVSGSGGGTSITLAIQEVEQ